MTSKARVLFVCTANAARSQLAQALLRHTDSEHFEAFSAGTVPTQVDPRALDALSHLGVSIEGLRSKSVDEFRGERFDYVITLCDKAAAECQSLPEAGEALAWSFEDPATSTKPDAFRHTLHEIHERIKMFVLVKTKR
ncbi:arsenate reductase ArsC [Pseudomonas extremaustralis]|jgi:protein-tyrosine-phosphatase|uniref:arsenate reductase ArsC n=1 Tax=Pseudomonas extremaustralis TaxID=359110 RepID=UPI00211A462F|nr:arsenate reductase ArsC [Pseudomonas extremaustralis]MCQ9186274.1 arsenate reductase ArsC [Streptomyces hayashii]MDG2966434.1 arsenate reductase ArsC [Pseudomonas extremaustralis]